MKTTITKTIIASVMALFTFNAFAQKNFYLKLNGAYNLGTTATLNGLSNQTQSGTVTTNEIVELAFGKGINFGGAVGYMFNKNIGTELNISYLLGGTTTAKNSSNSSTSSNSINLDYSSTMLSFIPSIVITPGFEKINPYARFGLIIGVPTVTGKLSNSNTFNGETNTTNQTTIFNGSLAFGSQSAFGIDYKINDKFSLFGELNFTSLTYTPTKGEITESKLNGVDNLATLNTRDKKIEYVDIISQDINVAPDPNAPQKAIKPSLPFSSVGINVGVVYHF
ncbi:MAG: outer membrane beta-barrel protein [Candidatus Methylacidiphilales bacterium]